MHLKEAIRWLHPDDNILSNSKQLGSTLLGSCHAELLAKVDKRLSDSTMCLTTDGWTNIKNDSVINYMAVSPSYSLFLESVSNGHQAHDYQFIAGDIARVICRHDKTSFAGSVTDHTSTIKKAWKVLREKFLLHLQDR